MAKVHVRRRRRQGVRVCGRAGCGREIQPGEDYYSWSFRNGGLQVRCIDHPPLRHELTESKLSRVYEAVEEAQANLGTLDETKDAMQALAETAREVVDEYRELPGGAYEEIADSLEVWVEEIENFEPEEPEETEFEEERYREEALEKCELEDQTFTEAMQSLREEWEEEHGDDAENAAQAARESAEELLSQCP